MRWSLAILAAAAMGCCHGLSAEPERAPLPPDSLEKKAADALGSAVKGKEDGLIPPGSIRAITIPKEGEVMDEIVSLETFHLSDWGVPIPQGTGGIDFIQPVFRDNMKEEPQVSSLEFETDVDSKAFQDFYVKELKIEDVSTSGVLMTIRGANEFGDQLVLEHTTRVAGAPNEVEITKTSAPMAD
jgi:hypothetical protein